MGVPNTTTFSLNDVKTAVGNFSDLADLFKQADSAQFDPLYSGNKDNLLNFRNYGNQPVWRSFNAYGPSRTENSKLCGSKPNVTLYYKGTNSSCIQIGDLVCNNSSGSNCRLTTGYYYTTSCFNEWIRIIYDFKESSYTVTNLGYCYPP